jgi:hypothetical protein
MTARSGIGDAPQCQKEVRCVTGRDRSHRVLNHRRYPQRLLRTMPRLAIPRLFCCGLIGKRHEGRRIHTCVAGTGGQVINLALLIPVHLTIPAPPAQAKSRADDPLAPRAEFCYT